MRCSDCADGQAGLHLLLFTSPEDRISCAEAKFVCIILVPSVSVSSYSVGRIQNIHF